eukprot:s3253_g1.t1
MVCIRQDRLGGHHSTRRRRQSWCRDDLTMSADDTFMLTPGKYFHIVTLPDPEQPRGSGTRALEHAARNQSWEVNLTDTDDWKETVAKHF